MKMSSGYLAYFKVQHKGGDGTGKRTVRAM